MRAFKGRSPHPWFLLSRVFIVSFITGNCALFFLLSIVAYWTYVIVVLLGEIMFLLLVQILCVWAYDVARVPFRIVV